MTFLFICGREIDYTRNQVLLRAFNRLGEVDTIVSTEIVRSLFFRSISISLRTLPRLIFSRYDLIFVGFYGHLLMIPIGLFSRKPILFDAFVSTFDTLTADRMEFSPNSLRGKLAATLDRISCRLADKILLDTPEQERYFSTNFGVPISKLSSLPVSCNEDIFYPRGNLNGKDDVTTVLSYSSFLPIHGIDVIIKAAEILQKESIHFKLIGHGPVYKSIVARSDEMNLKNITFKPPVALPEIAEEIAAADICLGGHFGMSDKAQRVIPGKIYQMLAMQKAVIAADSHANKKLLTHGISAYLCQPGDPNALANAILELHQNPELRYEIAHGGRNSYEIHCSEAIVTKQLLEIVTEIVESNKK